VEAEMADIISISDEREQAEATQLRDEELRLLVSGVTDYAIFMLDPSGVVVSWNEGAERIKGYAADEIIGQHFSKLYPLEAVEKGRPGEGLKIAKENGSYQEQGWRTRKDGSRFWADVVITALWDKTGCLRGFGKVTRDLTKARRAELALRESEKKFRLLADNMPQLVWMCEPGGMNVYFNQRWVDYTGLTLEASYGRGWNTPFHPDEKERAWEAWNQAVATGDNYEIECRLRAEDGSYRWFFIKGLPLYDDKGEVRMWCGTCTEIDKIKQSQASFLTLALNDDLTGLLNRRGFSTLAEQQIKVVQRTNEPFLLIFVDIDKLKDINDALGHDVGSKAIVETAEILRSGFRQSDILARFGGDEFVVLALESGPLAETAIRAHLKRTLEAANSRPDRSYRLSLSLGIVPNDPGKYSVGDLLAKADALMYKEKKGKTLTQL
jgi:diguanylate cyclase (GGDEF)-like protein/PAS domain S-box-containing protein